MRKIITNRLFQIAVAGVIVACIGYTFLGTSTSVDQDTLETAASATTTAETTDAVDATNSIENTDVNNTSAATTEETSTTNSEITEE